MAKPHLRVQISTNFVYKIKQPPIRKLFYFIGDPNEIRTRVAALRGPRPRPLDDGTISNSLLT